MTNEEAIDHIKDIICENNTIKPSMVVFEQEKEALHMAIKALEQDTVPFDFELYQAGLMCLPKDIVEVLDKIRAEIEQLTSRYSISKERGGMGLVEWSDRLIKESDVLQIIDKYKAESEGKK